MAPSGGEEPYCYVALGDSISIDEYAGGRGRGGASLLAANRDEDFPQWRGKDLRTLHAGGQYQLLARDGATSHALLQSQLPRLESSGVRPGVVTLTVGAMTCWTSTATRRGRGSSCGRCAPGSRKPWAGSGG
jgi:hypothetical protein